MDDVVIVGAARTPTGRFLGGLSTVPATQLGATAIRAALARSGVPLETVDSVIMGQVLTSGVGMAPARQAAIAAGIPVTSQALSVNMVCASGLAAVVLAARQLREGESEAVVAGGMESMSLAPHLLRNSRTGIKMGTGELVDSAVHDGLWCAWENHHMGNSAEAIAAKYAISRQEQDDFALLSHRKALMAIDSGGFRQEIAPVEIVQRKKTITVDTDECPRRDTSAEALASLSPAFRPDGTVTAGNAPALSDGAAAMVLTTSRRAKARGWPILAKISGNASANMEPKWLFDAPSEAVRRLLARTGRVLSEFDLIEVNEAFSAQALANGKALGWDWSRVNVKGGAVALGHPIGCSGARILVTLLHSLVERDLQSGIAVLCHGGGGAVAVSVERA